MKRAVSQKTFDTAADNCVAVIVDGASKKHDRTRRLYNKLTADSTNPEKSFSSRGGGGSRQGGLRREDSSNLERMSSISSLSNSTTSSASRSKKLMGRMKQRRENIANQKSARNLGKGKSTKCLQVKEEDEEEEALPIKNEQNPPQYPQFSYGYPPHMPHPGIQGMPPPGYFMPPPQMQMYPNMQMNPQMQMNQQMQMNPQMQMMSPTGGTGWGNAEGLMQQQGMDQHLINQQQQELIRQQQEQLKQQQLEQQELLQKHKEHLLALSRLPPPPTPAETPSSPPQTFLDQVKSRNTDKLNTQRSPRSRTDTGFSDDGRESSDKSSTGRITDDFTVGILGFGDKSVLQRTIGLLKKNSFSDKFNPHGVGGGEAGAESETGTGTGAGVSVMTRGGRNSSFIEKTREGLHRSGSDRKVSQVLTKANRRLESRESLELDFNDVYSYRKESFTPKSGLLDKTQTKSFKRQDSSGRSNFAFENPNFSH